MLNAEEARKVKIMAQMRIEAARKKEISEHFKKVQEELLKRYRSEWIEECINSQANRLESQVIITDIRDSIVRYADRIAYGTAYDLKVRAECLKNCIEKLTDHFTNLVLELQGLGYEVTVSKASLKIEEEMVSSIDRIAIKW